LQYDSPQWPDRRFRGPFPLINCALNLGGSSDLAVKTRHSASFTLTPLSCGSDRKGVGYAPLYADAGQSFAGGVKLGEAISISGAAASPNRGYHTSPLVAFLLTMFNVRLAWWFPNPAGKGWTRKHPAFSLGYLFLELFGMADETSRFVNVSDGGHFENLGVYELVRRRAKVIIACDAECDAGLTFPSLGNVIRVCETDFGAKIELDVSSIRPGADGLSRAHCATGRIFYSNGSQGYLIYLKSSITGDEDVGIEQYRANHPAFPHESTANQFFAEDQFEAYRRLGYHVAGMAFRGAETERDMVAMAGKLVNLWAPTMNGSSFVKHADALSAMWDRFRNSASLEPLLRELTADLPGPMRTTPLPHDQFCACLELLQLMENVFLELRLDEFWDHPDHRGWAMLFTMWAKSPGLRAAWEQARRTYGIRFEYFCHERLGLNTDQPVVRL
jgi:hypothetical protein